MKNKYVRKWLQFWFVFGLLLLILFLMRYNIFLIFIGPMGIVHGCFIAYIWKDYKSRWIDCGVNKEVIYILSMPYYIYYISVIVGSFVFFRRIL
ncbi:hypothetical protein DXB30_12290 [Coprobacillus cateniformis]|jgi:hypothetical protein|nr:hypothetical protein DXB30_12290 [Coprobacillus cateniformis]RGO23193.1 hypothetical protein DXB26_12360 [Coprobacillus cateniformis]RGY48793.1 hypothetical protein DXA41_05090 [Coprobacillus cateniformis]